MDTNEANRPIEDPGILELMQEGYSKEEAIMALRLSEEMHSTDNAPSSNLLVNDNQQNNHNKPSNEAQNQETDPRVLELIEGGMDEDEAIMAIQMSIENDVDDNACDLAANDFIEDQELQLAIQMSQQEDRKDNIDEIISWLSKMNITNDIGNAGNLFHCDSHSNIKCEKVTECPQMEVICTVLAAYHKFITQRQEEKKYDEENSQVDEMILEFYPEGREKIDLINDFNHLLKYHASEFEDIYNLFIDRIYKGIPCDLKTCKLLKRNQRDRSKECNHLYHTTENEEIVLEQLLDRVHCYFFHTFDIGYKPTKEDMENIIKEVHNMVNNQMTQQSEFDACDCKEIQQVDDESDGITNNTIMSATCKLIKEKSKNYHGVDGLERLCSTQNRFRMYDFQNDKVRRKWKIDSNVEIFSKAQKKWMEGVIINIKTVEKDEWLVVKYDGFRTKEIQRFSEYIRPIQSEAACNEFDFGYRFFYWPYYKDKLDIDDNARGLSMTGDTVKHAANTGYTVGDLYVEAKYDDLKQELLKNKICTISLCNWYQELGKAREYLRTDYCKQMECARMSSAENYGLRYGWRITENQLAAIVLYCGQDQLQREFSDTFREKSNKDTIADIIKRHREFHHFARLLRECVECFGMEANVDDDKTTKITVYHGASKKFMFESLFAYVKGPFSTSRAMSVAANFAGHDGIIVELEIDAASWTFKIDEGPKAMQRITCFPCIYLSDFSNEEEIFNIGGLNRFHFVTVLEKNGINYAEYIKGIKQLTTGMTHGGIAGDALDFDIPKTVKEKQIAYRLGMHQLFKHLPDHELACEFKSCPEYVDKFMDSHCKHIKTIHVRETRPEFEENIAFNWFFRNEDDDWIKLDDIMACFPGVEHIQYYAHNKDASFLDDIVLPNLFGLFEKTEKKYYPRFSISVDPSQEFENEYLPEIVNKYKDKFANVGWGIRFYATNPLDAWIGNNESFKLFADAFQHIEFLKEIGMQFLKKYNANKMLRIWCKGAQKKGFKLLDDWKDTDTLVFDIRPLSPRT